MMHSGTFRKRATKQQSNNYSPSGGGGGYYDENNKKQELPNDLVDYYLKERFNIDLHSQKNRNVG